MPHRTSVREAHGLLKNRPHHSGGGPILKRVFEERDIVIGEILPDEAESLLSKKAFVHIDPTMDEWEHLAKAAPAKETRVQVFQILRDVTKADVLSQSFGRELDELCLEQSQIARFVRAHCHDDLMHDCRSTLFLTKIEDEPKPVLVEVRSYHKVDKFIPRIVHNVLRVFGGPRRWMQIVVPAPKEQ